MNRANRAVATIVVMSGLIVLSGCKHEKQDAAPMTSGGAAAPPTVSEINSAKLNQATVPQAVQTEFNKAHPGASIDNIKMHATSTGQSYYEITYISQGQPGAATYYASGAKGP
jgi:hypothetical protein